MTSNSVMPREAVVDCINAKRVLLSLTFPKTDIGLIIKADNNKYSVGVVEYDESTVFEEEYYWRVSGIRRPNEETHRLCFFSIHNKVLSVNLNVLTDPTKDFFCQKDWPAAEWEFHPSAAIEFRPHELFVRGRLKTTHEGFNVNVGWTVHTFVALLSPSRRSELMKKIDGIKNCEVLSIKCPVEDERHTRANASNLMRRISSLAYQLVMKAPKVVISLRSCYGRFLTASQDGKSVIQETWLSKDARWTLVLQPTGFYGYCSVYLKSTYNKVLALELTSSGWKLCQAVWPIAGWRSAYKYMFLELDPNWPLRPLTKLSEQNYSLLPLVDGTFKLIRKPGRWERVEEMLNWVIQVEKAMPETQVFGENSSRRAYKNNYITVNQTLPSIPLGSGGSQFNSGGNTNGSGTQNNGDVIVNSQSHNHIGTYGNFLNFNNDVDSDYDDHHPYDY